MGVIVVTIVAGNYRRNSDHEEANVLCYRVFGLALRFCRRGRYERFSRY